MPLLSDRHRRARHELDGARALDVEADLVCVRVRAGLCVRACACACVCVCVCVHFITVAPQLSPTVQILFFSQPLHFSSVPFILFFCRLLFFSSVMFHVLDSVSLFCV